MGTMWLCSCGSYTQDWTERFHADLTQPVANAVYKTFCLAGMCSNGNTQRQRHDLPKLAVALSLFLICETAGTDAIGP